MKKLAAVMILSSAFVAAIVFPDGQRQSPVGAQVATPEATVTPTATPSPTATVVPPNPQALLQRAQKAFTAAGSGHIVGEIKLHVSGTGGGNISASLAGDVQWKAPTKAHLTGSLGISSTSKGSTFSTTTPVEMIVTPKYVAVRSPSTKKWSCSSLTSAAAGAKVPKGTVTSAPKVHTQTPQLRGTAIVDGVAVWHVHESAWDVVQSGKTKTKETTSAEVYISQVDSTIVRTTGTLKSGSGKNAVSGTYSADLSSYGEAVRVTVPKACTAKAKKPKLSALALRLMGFISSPAGLMRTLAQ